MTSPVAPNVVTGEAWTLNHPDLTHTDAISDTGDGYHTPVKGWLLRCLWCDWQTFQPKHADAVEKYREHEREAIAADFARHTREAAADPGRTP